MSHWQPPVIPAIRKKRGPLRPSDTSRVFYLDMPEPVKRLEKLNREHKLHEPPCSPERRNHPYPRYAKVIDCDVRFLNEPIVYMETKNTMKKEDHWWPTGKSHIQHYNPSYDRQTTQRTDFQNPACKLTCPPKYICKIPPSCGIVPLANPKPPESLPKILQEQISFNHQYNSRVTPNEPIRGKRHGAFVWTEIKPESGPIVPKGTEVFQSARGSRSLGQPKTEKGNSVESRMTSPSYCLQNSRGPLGSETRLSKPDVRAAAKACPSIPARGRRSSSISQTTEVNVIHPAREEPLCPILKNPINKSLHKLPTANKTTQSVLLPPATELRRA
ncbi:PREDICTED: uncharacterized protein C2orf73 homolog isoform X1 [Gavialis gangeticus]|uniref:uncharacterized protein C2orf73 homolog isoform X1 n=2 Tax=Gavialis gangeticus TaxID=94835 RepID=UPI00092E2569|nr:PREDICTED: uncharacterized protein C2orf73 homolog isoform X1 [Gavialis gangeticus]